MIKPHHITDHDLAALLRYFVALGDRLERIKHALDHMDIHEPITIPTMERDDAFALAHFHLIRRQINEAAEAAEVIDLATLPFYTGDAA